MMLIEPYLNKNYEIYKRFITKNFAEGSQNDRN
jgi:hypothetical protein